MASTSQLLGARCHSTGRILRAMVLAGILACLLPACAFSDLRPVALRQSGPRPQLEQRGRELLERSLEAVGGRNAWQSHVSAELQLRDKWFGVIGYFFRPWPTNPTELEVRYELGAPVSSARFLSGKMTGETWGRDGTRTYSQKPGAEERPGEGQSLRFILAAYQYFFELPLRITEASIIQYAGTRQRAGREYELVFATWGQIQPHREHDQYLLWIATDTGRIEIAQYTIRDKFKFATGVNFFSDFRTVDGIEIPHSYRIFQDLNDREPVHTVQLDRVQLLESGGQLPAPSLLTPSNPHPIR